MSVKGYVQLKWGRRADGTNQEVYALWRVWLKDAKEPVEQGFPEVFVGLGGGFVFGGFLAPSALGAEGRTLAKYPVILGEVLKA